MDFDRAEQVLRALEREDVRYAVFGGAALNFHGIARFTEDVDLFIAPERENIDRLKAALHSVFGDPDIDQITADDLLGDYPAIQYVPPDGSFHLDLLTRLGTAFSYADLEIVRLPFVDFEISVVSPRTLYRMKRDTVRLKDRADAELLRDRFRLEDD
jgi:Nucleotidyl transferase AbiEii toxin, Type IV TA system